MKFKKLLAVLGLSASIATFLMAQPAMAFDMEKYQEYHDKADLKSITYNAWDHIHNALLYDIDDVEKLGESFSADFEKFAEDINENMSSGEDFYSIYANDFSMGWRLYKFMNKTEQKNFVYLWMKSLCVRVPKKVKEIKIDKQIGKNFLKDCRLKKDKLPPKNAKISFGASFNKEYKKFSSLNKKDIKILKGYIKEIMQSDIGMEHLKRIKTKYK